MPYPDRAQSPLYYAYPMTPPPAILSAPAPLNGQLVIPPYTSHDGRLWFPPPPPAYIGDPSYYPLPPLRSASANPSTVPAPNPPSGLPVSGTPEHVLSSFPHPPPQPEQTIGRGTLAARISHHLRATSRARSVSPPLAPSQLVPPSSTQLEVEVLAPKPMPSPKLVSVDPFTQSFGRVGTRTRCLSVVKLEEMAARAAAEGEAKAAAADKTLPAPPVPSGKPLGYGEHRRPGAQDIFGKLEPPSANTEPETAVPRTPSLSALSLLRPPQRHNQPSFPSREKEDSGLDALERRLVEQVGTRRHPPPPLPNTDVPAVMADPPPAPVPAPVPVPGKGKGKAPPTAAEELESAEEMLGVGATVNESAISSLALGAEEDFGGRNANVDVLAGLEGEGEDVEGEDVDADADGRTQRLSKGAGGASSGSERGTHKARSRKSVKSDSKDREKDREKKAKKKREVRDEEAAKLKRAAKGRVAEWLEKLAPPEPEQKLPVLEPSSLPTEPAPAPIPAPPEPTIVTATPTQEPPAVIVESKPDPRSSGFISVATLRRAPISLPAPESAPNAPAARRVANKYPPPSQVAMKYDVKSARGGRGGRVTAVASIWAEASKAGAPTQPEKPGGPATKAKGNNLAERKATAAPKRSVASTPKPVPPPPQAKSVKPMTSIVAPGATTKAPTPRQPTRAAAPPLPPTAVAPMKAEKVVDKEDAPPRVQRALFGLGVAAAATPSSPALSSSIATPVLSSTASLAHPPGSRARASASTPTPTSSTPVAASRRAPSPRAPAPPLPPSQPQPQPQAAGWRAPLVSGAGLKADLAFGQARLRDLIRRYQGQAT